MNGLRRLAIRRIFGGIAGVLAAQTTAKEREVYLPATSGAAPSPEVEREHDTKQGLANPLYRRRDYLERERMIRDRSYSVQDYDLLVLGSTSPSWRAAIMRGRLTQQWSAIQHIQDRIDRIWQEPLEKIKDIALSWIRGDA